MAEKERIIGPISAYAIAKAQGYTGTEAQFATYIANAATNATKAEAAADKCEALTESLPADFTQTQENFAQIYDDENGVYRAGEYALSAGVIYKALCDILTPEAFNTLKWLHLDIGYALKEMENHEIAYHNIDYQKFDNNGASTYYVERSGEYYTFGGYQATNANTMKVFLTRSIWTTVNSAATNSGRPTELVLKDGHTYELALEYVQGSNVPSYPMSSGNVGIYPGFLAKGTWRPVKGTRYGEANWTSNRYSRLLYDKTEYPNGIAPIVEIYRNGIVDEEHENSLYFNGYTVKIVLRDITEQLAVAPVEHWQAISAHAVGDIFWLDDGNLYRATSQILQAETIVPGSGGNCTATTIANELASLRAQLA